MRRPRPGELPDDRAEIELTGLFDDVERMLSQPHRGAIIVTDAIIRLHHLPQ